MNFITNYLPLLITSGLWFFTIWIVGGHGNFPLNDDWIYAGAIENLLLKKGFQLSDQATVFPILQIYLGQLVCKISSFSFENLRHLTFFISWLTIFVFHQLLIKLNCHNKKLQLIFLLTLSFNPIFYCLSFTFMTDIYSLFFTLTTVLFFVQYLSSLNRNILLLALFFNLLAVLVRSPSFILSFSMIPPLLFSIKKETKKRQYQDILLLLFFSLFLFKGVPSFLNYFYDLPQNYGLQIQSFFDTLKKQPFNRVLLFSWGYFIAIFHYLGLFFFPLIFLNYHFFKEKKFRHIFILILALLTICLIFFKILNWPYLMPFAGNLIFDLGLGPIFSRDIYHLSLPYWPKAPQFVWLLVTFASTIGASFILSLVINSFLNYSRLKKSPNFPKYLFLMIVFVIFIIPQLIVGFYDRYLLIIIPIIFVLPILLQELFDKPQKKIPRKGLFLASTILIIFTYFCVGGTHDRFERSRNHWRAIHELFEDGVHPHEIDGGFEYSGRYTFKYYSKSQGGPRWIINDNYLVALGSIPGFKVIKTYPFKTWLNHKNLAIHVLRKED